MLSCTLMEVVSLSPFRCASLVWQPKPGAWVLTIACKATYVLQPGEATLAPEQEEPNEDDNYWDDNPSRSLQSASDLVPVKPRVDVLLIGNAYAPDKQPVRSVTARMIVGEVDKSIEVYCDRFFTQDGQLQEGPRFTKMRLVYERATGGPETSNPVGIRRAERDPYGKLTVPNLQPAGLFITKPTDAIEAIGFGPIAPTWPSRREKLGRSSPLFTLRDLASAPLPEDIDPSFFNVAPRDQQMQLIRGNERITLENLHPEHARLSTNLSGVHPRAFLEGRAAGPQMVPMRADTLWIDTDQSLCTLTWRAQVPLDDAHESGRVLVALEQPGQTLSWADIERQAGGGSSRPSTAAARAVSSGPTLSNNTEPVTPAPLKRPKRATLETMLSVPQAQGQGQGGQALPFAPSAPSSDRSGLPFAPSSQPNPDSGARPSGGLPFSPQPAAAGSPLQEDTVIRRSMGLPFMPKAPPSPQGGSGPKSGALSFGVPATPPPKPTSAPPGQSTPGMAPQTTGLGQPPPGLGPQPPGIAAQSPGIAPPGKGPQPPGMAPPTMAPQSGGIAPQTPGMAPPGMAAQSPAMAPPGMAAQPPGMAPPPLYMADRAAGWGQAAPPTAGGPTPAQPPAVPEPPPAYRPPPPVSNESRWVGGSGVGPAADPMPSPLLGAQAPSSPQGLSASKDAPTGALLIASNAAAAQSAPWDMPRPDPNAAAVEGLLPGQAAPRAQARPDGRDVVELVWFQPDSVARICKQELWRAILDELEDKPSDLDLDDIAAQKDPQAIEDRRAVFELMARAPQADAIGIHETLDKAILEDGKLVPPLVMTAGELVFPFDEVETLRATVTTVTPLSPGDENLRAAIAIAREFLGMPGLASAPAVAEGLTSRVKDAFAAGKRSVPPDYLQVQVDRALLEQRHYQRRPVFGDVYVRAFLTAGGSSNAFPTYLPDAISKKLPLFQRFKVRMIVEAHMAVDQFETHPTALRVLALARVIERPRR